MSEKYAVEGFFSSMSFYRNIIYDSCKELDLIIYSKNH